VGTRVGYPTPQVQEEVDAFFQGDVSFLFNCTVDRQSHSHWESLWDGQEGLSPSVKVTWLSLHVPKFGTKIWSKWEFGNLTCQVIQGCSDCVLGLGD